VSAKVPTLAASTVVLTLRGYCDPFSSVCRSTATILFQGFR